MEQPVVWSSSDHTPPTERGIRETVQHSSPWTCVPEERERLGQRLQHHMGEWEKIGGERLIQLGITPMWNRESVAKERLRGRRRVVQFRGTQLETQAYRLILQEEIREGIVIPVPESYIKFFNSTFLVPKKDGGFRKVLNCKEINKHMRVDHFKMDSTKTVQDLLLPGDYAVSIDLKSAYNHLSVHPALRPYLGFVFEGKSFCYVAMPFGLCNAPRVFTKTMRLVMTHIRERWGVRCVAYLDDLLFLDQERGKLLAVIEEVLPWLDSLGWTINTAKSELEPKQVFNFLGWQWNSTTMEVCLGKEKQESLQTMLDNWMWKMGRHRRVKVRDLAGLIGSLNATRLQNEKASLYLVKHNRLKDAAVQREGWDSKVMLTEMLKGEMMWWRETLRRNEPKSLLHESKPDVHLWADASPEGWGAWIQRPEGRLQALGKWQPEIANQTNNFRELWAVIMAIKRFAIYFSLHQIHHVRVHSDNSSVVFNIRRKAASRNLYPSIRHLLSLCDSLDLHLSVEHIPGEKNGIADSLSRLSRSGDYSLKREVFQQMCNNLQVNPTVDMFATARNAQLPRFVSPVWNDQVMVRDSLSIPWGEGMPYLHPPIPLISKCLRKVLQENVPALLVLPLWKGQSWSVLLNKMTNNSIYLGRSEDVLIPGHQMQEKGDKLPPGSMAAHLLLPPYSL
jgi:ribonuclease HI